MENLLVVVGHDGHQDTQLLRNDDECSVWEGPVGKDVVGRDVVGVITQYTPRSVKVKGRKEAFKCS